MAFSIFELDSFNNWTGDFAKENNLSEAIWVTSSLVLKLMRQLTKIINGSLFFAIIVTLEVGKPSTVVFSFLIPTAMLKTPVFLSIDPQPYTLEKFLEEHPKIKCVYYPGLESHPDHEIACAQMKGFGGVVSFDLAGDLQMAKNFVHHLKIPYLAPSLGGVESLVSHPATISYYDLSWEERQAINITDQLIRYAVGIEEVEDLIEDIKRALHEA